jgi:hypothetical protein
MLRDARCAVGRQSKTSRWRKASMMMSTSCSIVISAVRIWMCGFSGGS